MINRIQLNIRIVISNVIEKVLLLQNYWQRGFKHKNAPHFCEAFLVGVEGFEPPTLCL